MICAGPRRRRAGARPGRGGRRAGRARASSRSTARCARRAPGVYAIGDLVAGPALAHKASDEGIIAAEDSAGLETHPLAYVDIPRATFCTPNVGSFGLTEAQAREQGYDVVVGKVPYGAVGGGIVYGDRTGLVKLVGESKYGELLGGHIVGARATELIQELVNVRALEGGYPGGRAHHPRPPDAVGGRDGGGARSRRLADPRLRRPSRRRAGPMLPSTSIWPARWPISRPRSASSHRASAGAGRVAAGARARAARRGDVRGVSLPARRRRLSRGHRAPRARAGPAAAALAEPFPFDSSLAMRAATYAKSIGRTVPFAQAAFRQAFAGGRSLERARQRADRRGGVRDAPGRGAAGRRAAPRCARSCRGYDSAAARPA